MNAYATLMVDGDTVVTLAHDLGVGSEPTKTKNLYTLGRAALGLR